MAAQERLEDLFREGTVTPPSGEKQPIDPDAIRWVPGIDISELIREDREERDEELVRRIRPEQTDEPDEDQ